MLHVLTMLAVCAVSAGAQTPKPAVAPTPTPAAEPQPTPAARPAAAAEPVNVRFQILIREVGGPRPGTKTVALTIALNDQSSIRAQGTVAGRGEHPLNVDVMPRTLLNGRVWTRISVEYRPESPAEASGPPPFYVRQTLNVWLESGKPIIISEAADPISDRRLSVEVTATILR